MKTEWQVLQVSGFDSEADITGAALAVVPPRPEEGGACSILREGALFWKAFFADSSVIDVQRS